MIHRGLLAACSLVILGSGGLAVAAPSKGSTLVSTVVSTPVLPVSAVAIILPPSAVVVSAAPAAASGVAPGKGSGSTTGLPAGGPPLGGISPPPLPPSAPVVGP